LQFTQANARPKIAKELSPLPTREFLNFSPSLLKKLNTRHATQRLKSNMDKDFSNSMDRTPAANSTYKKLAVQW
jgi:hypothetical protein